MYIYLHTYICVYKIFSWWHRKIQLVIEKYASNIAIPNARPQGQMQLIVGLDTEVGGQRSEVGGRGMMIGGRWGK